MRRLNPEQLQKYQVEFWLNPFFLQKSQHKKIILQLKNLVLKFYQLLQQSVIHAKESETRVELFF